MNNPLISIITPCYNAAKFVAQTIESVQQQSYSNWEMIIVDDCSTDNSFEVIRNLVEKDSRIKLYQLSENTGSPAAPRNKAIELSKGEIVAFLDADDLWMPQKLEVQLKYMLDKDCDIVYSNGIMVNEDGKFLRSMNKTKWVDYRKTLQHDELSCSSVMIKKNLLNDSHFVKQPKEDLIFWLDVLKKTGAKAFNVNESLYAYRVVPNSRSRDKKAIIKHQWRILREVEKLSFPYAAYNFFWYIWINLKKYYL